MTLQSSADFLPQCQYILDNSRQPYAQLLASTSLEALVTQFWNHFTNDYKVEMRNYVLNYLATHSGQLEDFVVGSLAKLVARITKLGWFDCPEHREIMEEVAKFLQATIDHHIIGLKILTALVEEMNIPISGRTLTFHRKAAVSFRDISLFKVFQMSITTLRHLQMHSITGASDAQEKKMAQLSLTLANSSLSFDFIGTNPEESSEDVGTVQVPSSWRPIVQDTQTMQLFFDVYLTSEPPRSNLALEALVQLSSVRRSLFTNDAERAVFLQSLMSGIQGIMKTKKGLGHVENYHEFCRLLGRLKACFQLAELVKIVGFNEWITLATDFTVRSLQNWQYSMNSIHYLLALWGRMVAALPYLRTDASDSQAQAQMLRQGVFTVVKAYIETMLDSVDVVVSSDGDVEDPLDDEGSLREQMERLPTLARLHFETVAQYLLSTFEANLSNYERALSVVDSSSFDSKSTLAVIEGKLTWLVHMAAAIIGSTPAGTEARKAKAETVWDGQLARCVFLLVNSILFRLASTSGRGKADAKLELALLTYFSAFKKSYLNEAGNSPRETMSLLGSSAHPLLSFALGHALGDMDAVTDSVSVFDSLGIGEMTSVMNTIVNKICNNIRFWQNDDRVLEQTLDVFIELISTYSSSKALLALESIDFLVKNHVGAHFPFLGYNSDNKYRTTFYTVLSKLVFSSAEDLNNSFDVFIEPNIAIMVQLGQMQELYDPAVRLALIGALRDLRGITTATMSKRTYMLLFDALFPVAFPFLSRVAEAWSADTVVMVAVMKFLKELVANKSQRIQFDLSSANGILLFRETSSIVCIYGSKLLQLPVQRDVYSEKYKGISLILQVLTLALSGGYVNFGVFALYDDKALQNALDISLQLCLQVPIDDIMAYVKLSKGYFGYLEALFSHHLDVICGLDTSVFVGLVKNLHEGLQCSGKFIHTRLLIPTSHFIPILLQK
jgi:exportin-7